MHKNQLQELAQRSNFNLPAYSCIREGPDHAPRFKATVNFNGELFDSPEFFSNLRQAEHAAAGVALNVLLKRGPSQSLAAKVLVETAISKNMLQETAQRAGLSLPSYKTIKDTSSSVPVFTCAVEVGGEVFLGMPAKSKKQAEKNAAMVALSSLKQSTQPSHGVDFQSRSSSDMFDGGRGRSTALTLDKRGPNAQVIRRGGRSRVRMVNVRGRDPLSREISAMEEFPQRRGFLVSSTAREGSYESQRFLFNQKPNTTNRDRPSTRIPHQQGTRMERLLAGPAITERTYESQRFLFNQQPAGNDLARSGTDTHQQSQPLSGVAFDSRPSLLSHNVSGLSGTSTGGGGYVGKAPLPPQLPQQRARRMFLQSSSDRIELQRPLGEDFQLQGRDEEFDWAVAGSANSSFVHAQQYKQQLQTTDMLQPRRRVQSERFELKPSLFDELYLRDEEEWGCGEAAVDFGREKVSTYTDIGKYMFQDAIEGTLDTTSHISADNNEPGSACSQINRRYRDAGSSLVGYDSASALQGAPARCNEQLSTPLPTHTDIQMASRDGFSTDATRVKFSSEEALKANAWSSKGNWAASNMYDTDEKTTSSSNVRWASPGQQLRPYSLSPCHALYSWGSCTAALQAPVHTGQEVAACSRSAAAPYCAADRSSDVTNIWYSPLLHGHHTTNLSSDQANTSASELLKHLSLE